MLWQAMKLTVNEALMSSLETMMPGARVWALEFIAGGGGGASQVYNNALVYNQCHIHILSMTSFVISCLDLVYCDPFITYKLSYFMSN